MLVNGEELTVWDRYTHWPPIMTGFEFFGILLFGWMFRKALFHVFLAIIELAFTLISKLILFPFRKRSPKQEP